MTSDRNLVLRGGRPWGHDGTADVVIRDGRIDSIGTSSRAPDETVESNVVDVTGCVLLPGLVEAHCHLDKTLFGMPWVPHSARDELADRIHNDRTRRAELGIPRPEGVRALLETMAAAGTSVVRSHTDVDPEVGLHGIEVVADVADDLSERITVEQVAFPQHGLLTNPGTERLLGHALQAGAAVVGGIDPAGMDRDPVAHLDAVFRLAERHQAKIDIHLHDGGSLGLWELDLICERTTALGMAGRVAVSHAYALGESDPATQALTAERLAAAGVAVVTCAVYNFPVAPLKALAAAGVEVGCGHDGIRDLWGPYGSGDPLERAMHLAYRSTFRRDEDIELALRAVTYGAARVLDIPDYGLVPGACADVVAVRAETPAEAVVRHPDRALVLRRGRVVTSSGGTP